MNLPNYSISGEFLDLIVRERQQRLLDEANRHRTVRATRKAKLGDRTRGRFLRGR